MDELALVFLGFIVIIISTIVYKLPMFSVNMALLVGVLSTLLISNINVKGESDCGCEACGHIQLPPIEYESPRYQSKNITNGGFSKEDSYQNVNEDSYQNVNEDSYQNVNEDSYQNVKEAENQFSEKDVDVALYNNYNTTKNIYYNMACPGDNALADRMLEQGKRPQQATDNRAKFDKYSMLHYLDEELNSTANSRWWDNDALEHLF
jgi:hypothetical protein